MAVGVWQWGTLRFPWQGRLKQQYLHQASQHHAIHLPPWQQCQTLPGATGDLDDLQNPKNIHIPIGSMGLVYLPTWMLNFYGKLVGKYTIAYMDGMGYKSRFYINLNDILIIPSSFPDRIVFYNWFVLSKPYHAFSSTIPSEEFLRSSLSHDKGKS